MERNFKSYPNGVTDTLNQPYDIKSIMHYRNKAFSKNGGNTIVSRRYPLFSLGAKQEKLSPVDTSQVNQLYKCHTRPRRRFGYYGKLFFENLKLQTQNIPKRAIPTKCNKINSNFSFAVKLARPRALICNCLKPAKKHAITVFQEETWDFAWQNSPPSWLQNYNCS